MGTLKGKDILHGNQFSRKEIDAILKMAAQMEKELKGKGSLNLLRGKILVTLFFEPSTRTRLSFEAAMQRLGGGVVSMGSVEGSSVAKGETLADTAQTVAKYADVIVVRHPRLIGDDEHGWSERGVFIVEGGSRTVAEMPEAEKNRVSHRGQALAALAAAMREAGW